MKKQLFVAVLLLVPCGAAFALRQDKQDKKVVTAAAPAVDDPMMAKWAEFMTPGPAHAQLDHKVGKWTGKAKFWTDPSAPVTESIMNTEFKWILGKRYLQDTTTGVYNGETFEGLGMTGFDNLKKKYVSTWIDNMGTGLSSYEGTFDAAAKTFSFMGMQPDVMQGKYVKSRMVDKVVDADHWTFQMYTTLADGKEFMSMEIHYARAK